MSRVGGHPQQRWYDPLRYRQNRLRGLIIKIDKEAVAAKDDKDDDDDDDNNKLLMFTEI